MTWTGAALVALVVAGCLPWVIRRPRARGSEDCSRGREHPTPAVDDAVVIDLVRAALASGVDVISALEAVGEALPPAQRAPYLRGAKALRLGAPWEVAWPERSAVTDALEPAWTDGVDPEPLLAHAVAAIRRTRQARAREAAARLGVRLVLPLGLCLLPAFVLLGLVPVLLAAGFELWGR